MVNLPEITTDSLLELVFCFKCNQKNHDADECDCDLASLSTNGVNDAKLLTFTSCLQHNDVSFKIIKFVVGYYNTKITSCTFTTDIKPISSGDTFLFTDEVVQVLAEKCPNLHKLCLKYLDLTAFSGDSMKTIASTLKSLIELDVSDCYKVTAFNIHIVKDMVTTNAITQIRISNSCLINDESIEKFTQSIDRLKHLELYNCPNITYKGLIFLINVLEKINKECHVKICNKQKTYREQTLLTLLISYVHLEWSFNVSDITGIASLRIYKKCAPYRVAKIIAGEFFVERLRF